MRRVSLGQPIGNGFQPWVQHALQEIEKASYIPDPALATQISSLLALRGAVRVRLATTASVTISTALVPGQAIDGKTLVDGDIVLVKSQAAPAGNGIYLSAATPIRFADFDLYDDHPGVLVVVEEGTVNADTFWVCTSDKGGTLDTTAITFTDLRTAIAAQPAGSYQPLDSDLTTIAGLTATTNNFMQAKSSAWASRTPAQAAIDLLPFVYPVGCIYFSTNSTNPATSLGFGTWTAFGAGQVPVGFLNLDADFGADEATGGAKTVALTNAQVPDNVVQTVNTAGGAGNIVTAANHSATPGGAHNNLQPFIVVRMWKRTA